MQGSNHVAEVRPMHTMRLVQEATSLIVPAIDSINLFATRLDTAILVHHDNNFEAALPLQSIQRAEAMPKSPHLPH